MTAVFLDSAGSSLPPPVVLETVIAHLRREAEVGGYRAAAERRDELAAVKTSLARLIGAQAAAVALSDSATRAWTSFWYSVPLAPGDRILVSQADYSSNYIATLHRAHAAGATVEVMPSDETGQIDLAAVRGLLDERVRLVSIVHVPTNGGLINPAADLTRLAHEAGALVLLDACQSVGQLPVDVAELGVDALTGTGRKWLRAPRGTGFLYVRPELIATLAPAMLDNHSATWTDPDGYRLATDARRFEFWESNIAARLGLGAAVDHLLAQGPAEVYAAIAARAEYLRRGLSDIPGVTVRDLGRARSGIVSFTVDGHAPADVRDRLAPRRITVTVSEQVSTLLDMSARGLPAVVRASPHSFVGFDQLDRTIAAVAEIAPRPHRGSGGR